MKTTPNPKATKNSRGELVGPGLLLVVEVAEGAAEVDDGLDILIKKGFVALPPQCG